MEGVSPEAVFLLGKDLNSFREIGRGPVDGNAELRLPGTKDPQTKERLAALLKQYEETRTQAERDPGQPARAWWRRAKRRRAIVADSEPLRKGLQTCRSGCRPARPASAACTSRLLLLSALLLLAGGCRLPAAVRAATRPTRAQLAEGQRLEAERQEQEAKRVNDANQAAILRLMNELQTVAEGDLTQQATVTEDITGAIADSVNYTVEELRTLVSQVQGTVARVTDTTAAGGATSTELLATSTEQLREIRDTGESVLQMAGRINEVSAQAQQTAAGGARSRCEAAEIGPAARCRTPSAA